MPPIDKLSQEIRDYEYGWMSVLNPGEYDPCGSFREEALKWADKAEKLEIALAEYENDETNRRREDALKIRSLEREICTCPWPADAAKTRHLLSCRLMQMEHEALRAKEPIDELESPT